MEIEERSRRLFMKYALPCAGTLVRRGAVSQKQVDDLVEIVGKNKEIPKHSEKIFKVAFSACSLMVIDGKKKSVDEKVVREYFLFGHDEVIDKRYEEMGDFDPEECRTRVGVVKEAGNGFAIVSNEAGKREYRTDFVNGLKKGDIVVTHWNFVVEKVDKKISGLMKRRKEIIKKIE